ncbi:hypothetical protein GQ55_2G481200 [Panicum hallii var. hallii]|uniref:Uncharacterized protein n=1 Tax=Panicum hallii var. hallii TaxID=1504633 RepID=A0A2T7F0C7_9POAL|nr:hypothetical protein GQ55_2G481200 [Panicum hallii var. hallii]
MQQILDKVTGIEAWKSSATDSVDALLSKAEDTASRLHRLEAAPRPPPPPSWVDPFDLNLAPPVGSRSPATATERPSGHHVATSNRDVGGGILGSPPPRPVTGRKKEGRKEERKEERIIHPSISSAALYSTVVYTRQLRVRAHMTCTSLVLSIWFFTARPECHS